MPNILFPVEDAPKWDHCVVHIADFHFKENFHSRGRMRRIEWYYIVAGRGTLLVEDRHYDLHAGIMFQTQIGTLRGISCDAENTLKTIMIGCVGTKVERGFARAMGGTDQVFKPSNGDAIYKVASAMLASAAAYEPLAMQICSAYVPVLWNTIRQGRLVEPSNDKDNFSTYLKCKRYFDEHYTHMKQVDEVAYAIGISHEYMCRLFKRHAQTTPNAYFMLLRMNGAMQRLMHTDDPIKAIAYDNGFATASAFSKAYKRVMGMSPKFTRTEQRTES